MLTEARLAELETRYGRIGVVPYNGHMVVFRRPSREDIRAHRRKQDSPSERPDSMDQLAQMTIIAFDDLDDPTAARVHFTSVFLEEFPLATGNSRFVNCLSVLSGVVEEEDAAAMGEGFSVRPTRPRPSLRA